MHIPDGFISGATSAGTALIAVGGLGGSLRAGARTMQDRQIPMAGLTAASIFALQMINFPVAAGTSGHLLGGALAAILLGPALGITVVSVVVIMQALLFADGGISALGLNVVNMAVITVISAWLLFRGLMRVLPKRVPVALLVAMVAAWVSVIMSAAGFVVEYAVGGQGGIDVGTVFRAMIGVHALIGIGEGIITATVLGAVLAVRPDLVFGVSALRLAQSTRSAPTGRTMGGFAAAAMVAAIALVVLVAPLASEDPDGLTRVAADVGLIEQTHTNPLGSPLAGYGVEGATDERAGTVVAGIVGIVVTSATALMAATLVRRRRTEHHPAPRG